MFNSLVVRQQFVALFSVLAGIVYGQLPGNWNQNLHGFRPYVALPPSAQNNLFNSPIAAQLEPGEQPPMRHFPVLGTMALIDVIVQNYIRELETSMPQLLNHSTNRRILY